MHFLISTIQVCFLWSDVALYKVYIPIALSSVSSLLLSFSKSHSDSEQLCATDTD